MNANCIIKGEQNHAAILELLKNGPVTRKSISETLNMSISTAGVHLRKLRNHCQIYRSGWIVDGNVMTAQWSLGFQEDVPAPNGAQELAEKKSEEERIKRALAMIKIRRDPLVEALFGAYS